MSRTRRQTRSPQPGGKISRHGVILSVQPRIRLLRTFDQRNHSYFGYMLHLQGTVAGETREFILAIGEGVHAKRRFRAGDQAGGEDVFMTDPRTETAFERNMKLGILIGGCNLPASIDRLVNVLIESGELQAV